MKNEKRSSTTSEALKAAGDERLADDVEGLENAANAVDQKLGRHTSSLVERMIFGPAPTAEELSQGGQVSREGDVGPHPIVQEALSALNDNQAFDSEGKISDQLRDRLVKYKAHAFTVPEEFGGAGQSYAQLSIVLEQLSANGLGCLAVELSGQLTIGAGSLLGYGSDSQKEKYLPDLAKGRLIGFALTEVGVGVNAKKIQAYVEEQENGSFRLFADGPRNKLWITSARHGGLLGLVARLGKTSKNLGLFVIELPDVDIDEKDHQFWLRPSGVDAFHENYNSRIHFHNFPIAADARIPGDGVEVLFYCLRLGRCMLASMAAGYQRMMARDASDFAKERESVGGLVARHELPRMAITEILGNSLQSYALSHLSIAQDTAGIDLAGLRDLTKSASAEVSIRSMALCEHVMGGRAFTKHHRVNNSRANLHLFGVVEGEDNMIRMGMVRDVFARFSNQYLGDLLKVMATQKGENGPLRFNVSSLWNEPLSLLTLAGGLSTKLAFWRFVLWTLKTAIKDLFADDRAVGALSGERRQIAKFCLSKLRGMKWRYLWLTLVFQLELTRAQLPLVRMGQEIEVLVSAIAVLFHFDDGTKEERSISLFRAHQLMMKFKVLRAESSIRAMDFERDLAGAIGEKMLESELEILDTAVSTDIPIDWR